MTPSALKRLAYPFFQSARRTVVTIAVAMTAITATMAQIVVDYDKFPDANPYAADAAGAVKKSDLESGKAVTTGVARSSMYGSERPDHVNNALTRYYPPVFNQSGGSCGSAQAVAYCMTYEMNAYRNTYASLSDNQLPTHFTWLHTYAGIDKYDIIDYHGVPSVTDYGGRTYSETFGYQLTSATNYGYMQGYDKWYRAMSNRLVGADIYCDDDQMSEVGREQLKQWLWNHWGDETFYSGGVSGIGVASGGVWGKIPSTTVNDEIGVAGLYCVSSWGQTYDHALSVVGYDDRIEFDLDSNGVYGEADKDELGAWIICNSWGSSWCNGGFIYCPYKFSVSIGTSTLAMTSGHYNWRKDYEPKRVLKILMDYDHRSELSISAGIATDTAATEPEQTETMPFFNYAGDGTCATPAPEVPMLGKWKSTLNYDPMEFGYDVTDLTEDCDLTQPIKYFLCIKTKSTAIGSGNIYKVSLMDYDLEEDGMELPATIDTVAILNGGQTTLVEITVAGRQTYPPLNASLNQLKLTWNAPQASSYNISRYYIYKGSEKVAEVPSFSYSYTVDDADATYYVAAAYEYKDRVLLSDKSTPARNGSVIAKEDDNKTLLLSEASLTAPNLMTERLSEATIEFWLKPTTVGSNQQIGDKWGTFLFSASNSGQILCGWDNSDRVSTSANTLKAGTWYHVAVVVEQNTITVYVNGLKKGSCTSSTYSGIPALDNFYIGTSSGSMDGEIDELRIWSTARTMRQIYVNKGMPISNPSAQTDLLAYYPMATYESGGVLYLEDLASDHDIALSDATASQDNTILTGTSVSPDANFTYPDAIYAGVPAQFKANSPVNTTSWTWSAPDATTSQSAVINPYLTFSETGDHEVTLQIELADGTSLDSTHTVTVLSPDAPTADFALASDTLGEGEMLCLANKSTGANNIYTWTLPGANYEEMNSVDAAVTYSSTGTFPITLTVTNAGGTDQMTKYVTVSHSAPAVAFSVDPTYLLLGETTFLQDESRHNPDTWSWTLDNGVHTIYISGQNSSYTPTHPGVYDITLEATNDIGTTSLTETRKLMVANAESYNGLTFTGSESLVSTASPFTDGGKAFTIEWWMIPSTTLGALNMSTANDQISTQTNIYGEMTLTVGGKSVTSDEDYVIAGEWHHYAITFNFGTVKFYRDGVLITSPDTRVTTSTTDWGLLTLSDDEDPFVGQLDELRIWSKCLSLSTMKGYINSPLENPEELISSAGLVAYYDFNQSGGSVTDRSGNSIDLTRVGFGPDGDAWGLSRGVFTLDLDTSSASEEIYDADGLTHIYQAVAEGKASQYLGLHNAIRIANEQAEDVRIYTLAGQCVFNNRVEGVHVLPFEPGVYIVNGVKLVVR